MDKPDLTDLAVEYASRGWPIFPCRPGLKTPATRHGLLDATDDVDRIRRWWTRYPDSNIGLRTGITVDALDLDGEEGCESFDNWCADRHMSVDFSTLPCVVTPSGGFHLYFKPTGAGNRAGMLPGVDWRGRGGYVIAAGSVRADDQRYSWFEEWGATTDPPEAPEDLHNLVVPPQIRPGGTVDVPRLRYTSDSGGRGTRYGLAALDDEARRVASCGKGSRNAQLNESGFAVYQLVAGGQLDESYATETLTVAGMRCGLSEREIAVTLRSAKRGAENQPRAPQKPPVR